MSWILAFCLAAAPDAGTAAAPGKMDGIVEFGTRHGWERWGTVDAGPPPARSTLTVPAEEVKIRGALLVEEVRRVPTYWHAQLDVCAAGRLERTVTLELDVDKKGKVIKNSVKSSPADPAFEACAAKLSRHWAFEDSTDEKPSHLRLVMKTIPAPAEPAP